MWRFIIAMNIIIFLLINCDKYVEIVKSVQIDKNLQVFKSLQCLHRKANNSYFEVILTDNTLVGAIRKYFNWR